MMIETHDVILFLFFLWEKNKVCLQSYKQYCVSLLRNVNLGHMIYLQKTKKWHKSHISIFFFFTVVCDISGHFVQKSKPISHLYWVLFNVHCERNFCIILNVIDIHKGKHSVVWSFDILTKWIKAFEHLQYILYIYIYI